MEQTLLLILFFLYGLILGSFLNVCIYRLPQGISVAAGRSHCPACGHVLGVFELIPLIGYLFLGRKCRHCKAKISIRYPLVELLTGILFVFVFLRFGMTIEGILGCLLTCVLLVLSFIDLDTQEIPDSMHIVILLLAVVRIFFSDVDLQGFVYHLGGFFIISVPLFVLAYFTNGFGGGDIKLMAVCGLYLGLWQTVIAFFVGAFFGAIYGVYLLLGKNATGKTAFAFGPYLSIGIFLSLLYGEQILSWYLGFF